MRIDSSLIWGRAKRARRSAVSAETNWTRLGDMSELLLDSPPIGFPLSGCTASYRLVVHREYHEQREAECRFGKFESALGADSDA